VSFHSAGHVLGSAQIRLEAGGESWLVSGDYKRCADPSCTPFEPVAADVLISEATFGLPIYRWQSGAAVAGEILAWWQAAPERPTILFAYAFGKAQRLLAELAAIGVGQSGQPGGEGNEILLHGAVEALMPAYREAGVELPPTLPASAIARSDNLAGRLVIAPPSAHRSVWMKRFQAAANRLCERLDGGARRPPAAGVWAGLRDERPRRLARPGSERQRQRRPPGVRDPWQQRGPGPLPAGGGRHPCGTAAGGQPATW
jgi:hypothetical protein